MELLPGDKEIVSALCAAPQLSFQDIAAQVGMTAQQVAKRFRQLNAAGVVEVRGHTNPQADGRAAWLVRIGVDPVRARELANSLVRSPRSRWVRISMDRTEVLTGLVGLSEESDSVLDRLLRAQGVRYVKAHQLLDVPVPGWRRNQDVPNFAIDDLDRAILEELSRDGRQSNANLGRQLEVDSSTVSRRRRRMEEAGFLHYVVDVDLEAPGAEVLVWMKAVPGGASARGLGEIWEAVEGREGCRFFAYLSGENNVFADFYGDTYGEVLALIDSLDLPHVTAMEMQPVQAPLKRTGTFLPRV